MRDEGQKGAITTLPIPHSCIKQASQCIVRSRHPEHAGALMWLPAIKRKTRRLSMLLPSASQKRQTEWFNMSSFDGLRPHWPVWAVFLAMSEV
jgi:hypothetical protein